MADRVTCCPHCSTSFRITDAQLQTAKGAVRCGSCLQIFRALDHLEPLATPAPSEPPAPPKQVKPAPKANKPAAAKAPRTASGSSEQPKTAAAQPNAVEHDPDDDALISDDMDKLGGNGGDSLGELSGDFAQQGRFGEHKGSLFDREVKIKDNPDNDHADESWAVNLLEEIESEEPIEADDDTHDFDSEHDTDEPRDYSSDVAGSFAELDNDFDDTLGESSQRTEPRFSLTGERDIGSDTDQEASAYHIDADDDYSGHDANELIDSDNDFFQQAKEDLEFGPSNDELLQAIAPAPVEMEWHPDASPWPKRILWGSLSLLAGLALVIQYAWANFDELSRTQPWRNSYAALCPFIGCSLPPIADARRVKAYNLVVRSHPRAKDALIIDSILLNNATFEQPFPDFTLTFSNLKGKQVAYRRFTPEQYLGGELAGVTQMPVGQPIHISLEVVDPGPDAVNYTAKIPLN